MERQDLRAKIIPTKIIETQIETKDFIYIDSYEDQFNKNMTDEDRKVSATDYAKMNKVYISDNDKTQTGKSTAWTWLRTQFNGIGIFHILDDGQWFYENTSITKIGICPSLHYELPKDEKELSEIDIREIKNKDGKIIYHTIQIGEYLKSEEDKKLSEKLESLYNNGKLKEGIVATGRWYSGNGQQKEGKSYAGKHNPEFEFEGNRYARVISNSKDAIRGNSVTVRWVKVEPISFRIRNWDEMPQNINPDGNGNAKYFDLVTEEVIIGNIPFNPDLKAPNRTEWKNSIIREFLNGINRGECDFFNEAFNLSRLPMLEYAIPELETEISDYAFNGCVTLKKVIIHSGVKSIGKMAFECIDFKYAYRTKKGELVFSQELPQKDELSQILNKRELNIPYAFIVALAENGQLEEFYKKSDFRFFTNEIPNINEILSSFSDEEILNFFKFANSLGCFSNEKLLDEKGRKTQTYFAQKASSLLAQILRTSAIKNNEYTSIFETMPFDVKANQELLQVLSRRGKDGKLEKLQELLELEKNRPGTFIRVMKSFDGKKFYYNSRYEDVTKENFDIAEVFGKKERSQEEFEYATQLRNKAEKSNIPEHLLGMPIKEETILESIERIRKQTQKELLKGKDIIEELYHKQFTYEWLSKKDPHNSILGLFCECCAYINSSDEDGEHIAINSVLSPDVQNLIIRDYKGEIVAKGVLYLNRENGFAVINGFELNEKYKKHERAAGRYAVVESNSEEQEREMIFEAFQRGLNIFIKEYDRQNPDNPLKQINLGMRSNRLKRQSERFEKATANLTVPSEYGFKDIIGEQRILYQRVERQQECEGDER